MKQVTSFFKSVASGASKLTGGSSLRGRRAFNAYHSGDYDSMVQLCAQMTPAQFLKEVRQDDINILHAAATADNFDAMASLSALPFFSEVINNGENEPGWTPLLCACVHSHKQDLRLIKLLVENGANLLKPKKDGLTSMHFAASNNDIHFLDYILTTVDNAQNVANIKTVDGWTPAHYAGFLGNFDSLNLLLEHGADLKLKNVN